MNYLVKKLVSEVKRCIYIARIINKFAKFALHSKVSEYKNSQNYQE